MCLCVFCEPTPCCPAQSVVIAESLASLLPNAKYKSNMSLYVSKSVWALTLTTVATISYNGMKDETNSPNLALIIGGPKGQFHTARSTFVAWCQPRVTASLSITLLSLVSLKNLLESTARGDWVSHLRHHRPFGRPLVKLNSGRFEGIPVWPQSSTLGTQRQSLGVSNSVLSNRKFWSPMTLGVSGAKNGTARLWCLRGTSGPDRKITWEQIHSWNEHLLLQHANCTVDDIFDLHRHVHIWAVTPQVPICTQAQTQCFEPGALRPKKTPWLEFDIDRWVVTHQRPPERLKSHMAEDPPSLRINHRKPWKKFQAIKPSVCWSVHAVPGDCVGVHNPFTPMNLDKVSRTERGTQLEENPLRWSSIYIVSYPQNG